MRRNKNTIFGILALFVGVVAVGFVYAGFTQSLNINGTGNVVASKWDIYFANLANAVTTGTANVVTPATISPKTKIGNYYVELISPGDSITYTFDVVNDGDFDAVLSTLTKNNPTCTPTATLCNYLKYELKYTINQAPVMVNDILKKNEVKNMTLKLTLDPNVPASALPNTEISISGLGVTLLYSQASGYNGANSTVTGFRFVNRQVANTITDGDELAIEDEHFYVVSSDSTNTVLLAKYNLLVGEVYEKVGNSDGMARIKTLSQSDAGYGLQSSIAKGAYAGGNDNTAVVAFSGKGYWDNKECVSNGSGGNSCPGTAGLKSEYANSANAAGKTGSYSKPRPNAYRSSMSTVAPVYTYKTGIATYPFGYAQDNGYTIAYYVEPYIQKLKELGAPDTIIGRLLLYQEVKQLVGTVTYTVDQTKCENWFNTFVGSADWATICDDETAYGGINLNNYILFNRMESKYYADAGLTNVIFNRSETGNHLFDSTFWLGTTNNANTIGVFQYNGLMQDRPWNMTASGVRPVIEIPTSDIPS